MKDILFEKHLAHIMSTYNSYQTTVAKADSDAAVACANTTKEMMKGFAEWIDEGLWSKTESHGAGYRPTKGWYNTYNISEMKNPLTTEELLEKYLETLNQK